MRRFVCAALFGVALVGCEAKTVIPNKPLTDEQNAKVRAEDQDVANQESQGSVNKPKGKAKQSQPKAGSR